MATVDPSFAALLADPRTDLRPLPDGMTIARYRELMDRPLRAIVGPELPIVETLRPELAGCPVPLRLYRPTEAGRLPAILFLHGGGFVAGSLDTHDAMCRTLARASGAAVIAVDYALAPEARFPVPLEQCHAALAWLAAHGDALGLDIARLAICGDSAGGNLAIATAALARSRGPVLRHVALLYPVVDPGCASGSQQRLARGYMLTRASLQWFWEAYLGPDGERTDPRAAVATGDLAGLPPTSILTAAFDPLCDEGEVLGAAIRAAGGQVIARRYAGMIHGFASLPMLTPVAGRALADVADDLKASLRNT